MSTKYDNTNWFRLSRTGGACIAIIGVGGTGRGNAGVSIPCKGCWAQVREADFEGAWIATEGAPGAGPIIVGTLEGAQPMWIPISDVAELLFGGSQGMIVDIVYLLG